MAKRNYKYDATVDLSNLPTRTTKKCIDWKNSIGNKIPFTFDNGKLVGEFTIVDYKIPEGLKAKHVYLKYKETVLKPIIPENLKKAKLSNILDNVYIEWKFEIGDILKDKERNLKIINRKRKKNSDNCYRKYYQIACLNCGFDGAGHYLNEKYIEEYWVMENDLIREDKKRINCPCCSGRMVVNGINNIPTTARWMIDYFQGGYDEAKMYTTGSNSKKFFKCIHCGTISKKQRKINELFYNNGLPCICNDNISYPNKLSYYLFEQLKNQYEYYENEYSPDWAGNYRYDNFIVKNGKKYIVEMDGGLGHGNNTFLPKQKDVDGLKRDKEKDKLAFKNNIKMIRIDCIKSNLSYIKPNIISELSEIFDLTNVNWDHIDALAKNQNIYKDICDYYNKTNKFLTEISKDLNIGIHVVRSALSVGNEFGWCNYVAYNKFQEEKFYNIIDYWNKNKYIQTSVLSKKFKLGQSTIISYLKLGTELGLCDYNPVESTKYYLNNMECYPVFVFDKNLNFIKEYKSSVDCENNSIKDFGIKFNKRNIDYICNGKGKTHKGYYFSRVLDIDKDIVFKRLNSNSNNKKVYVYTHDYKYCNEYDSIKELCEKSMNDFGIQFNTSNVSCVCTGRYKQYKGYIFSFIQLSEQKNQTDTLLLDANG